MNCVSAKTNTAVMKPRGQTVTALGYLHADVYLTFQTVFFFSFQVVFISSLIIHCLIIFRVINELQSITVPFTPTVTV